MKTATIKAYYEIRDPFGNPIEITFVTELSKEKGESAEDFKINFRDDRLKKILDQGPDDFKANLITAVREEMQPIYVEWAKRNSVVSENKELTTPEDLISEFGDIEIKL